MLIVLDNFEQVVAAAPMVADLLQRAPRLHVLVTSRALLRVRGEQEWRVSPLGLVPAGADGEALAQAPAVRLFLERVRDVQPGFELTSRQCGGRWPSCAAGWTACRSPWSSRRPGCGCSRRSRCWPGSTSTWTDRVP